VYCVIESREYRIGHMAIPEGKFVLSGHGTADDFLDNFCQIGDTVRILQQQPSNLKQITQFVAGGPRILSNGVEVVDESYPAEHIALSFCTTRHPRTAVGFNVDSTVAYFVVADGRKSTSVGIGLWDLADFMASIGAKNAVNLDGGGSSSFVVRNSVKNDPSDGGERSVANSFLCVSSAANGPIEHIQVVRDSLAVYKNKSVHTGISGWDEYYNPTGIPNWDSITVTYDNTYGTFSNNVFTVNESVGNCVITADYKGDADSVLVHIIELFDLAIYPETVTTDSVNDIKFEVVASNEVGGRRDYDNELFEFTILDSNIASINKEGELIGKNNGETQIVVRYGTEYDTANVFIEIGSGEAVVDELETLTGWTLSSDSYINAAQTSVTLVDRIAGSGTKALKVDYARTGDEDGNIYFETTPIDVFGVPSDILVDVLSDSIKHWIYVLLEDARGVEYSVKCPSSLRYNDDYRTQYLDLARLLPADGEQLYPLKVTGIRLRIDDKASSGSLYVDRIRVIYPTWTSIEDKMVPSEYCLHQNYPNPFNPLTKITFEIAEAGNISLNVYDISGNLISSLMNGFQNTGSYSVEFSADYLPTGVYFYRLQAGNWVDTKKMLIIK
ncbi:MAG: phosphodiester glycosidase family protein, partial [Candidatus Marinimicrobia bacterium]|nr:phosphodiester glycosidase family protein [Candidatus Neomarinimicrobiota bacterium]